MWKKLQRTTMLGSIPHQKFILYHFPTRGRAGVKLGDAWYVSNVSIIFDGFMLLSCQTLDVLYAFYIFFGTNLLTQCQVPVPVFSMFLTPFTGDFEMESKRKKIPEKIFLEQKKIGELGSQGRGAPGGPQAPPAARGEVAPSRLVGPLSIPWPRGCAYKFPKIPKKIRRSSKVLFRRRKLLSPQDPIWGTFWCPAGGGIRIRRASSSTPWPLRWCVSSSP